MRGEGPEIGSGGAVGVGGTVPANSASPASSGEHEVSVVGNENVVVDSALGEKRCLRMESARNSPADAGAWMRSQDMGNAAACPAET